MKKLFSEEYTESQMNLSSEDTAFNLLEDIRCLQEDKAQLTAQVKNCMKEVSHQRGVIHELRAQILENELKVNRLKTPTQSLNTIKAEAIEEAMRLVYHEEDDHRGYYNSEALLNYAKQLREKG